MQTIEIKKDNAIRAYQAADSSTKTILETLLGKENVLTSLKERCTTMADVFREAGKNPADYVIPKDATPHQISCIRHARVDILCEVFREGKELGLGDQWWYLWYNRPNSASGWSLCGSDCGHGFACVGSRLCVCDKATTLHLDKHFRDEITAMLENRPA